MTAEFPCQSADAGDLWFSDILSEQQQAAKQCESCPLSRFTQCRNEGWDHEFGVWGGLTPLMRKRMDRKRYDAAVATTEARSLELDDATVDIRAREARIQLAVEADQRVIDLDMSEWHGQDLSDLLCK